MGGRTPRPVANPFPMTRVPMKKLLLVVLCSAPLLTLAAEGGATGSSDTAAPQSDTMGQGKTAKTDAKKKSAKKGKHAKKGAKAHGEGMHGGSTQGGSMQQGEQK
jgi:hypothetical protein